MKASRINRHEVSQHHLWAISVQGLRWYLSHHSPRGVLFLASSGHPVYHETENGNVLDGFARRWNDLVKRIRRDKRDFPNVSFGKIRKTAATELLKLADPHVASMLLAHKTISEDELLRLYANLPWERLYEAQAKLEQVLLPVFEAAGSNPWGDRPKTYIGIGPSKEILVLEEAGQSPEKIAEKLGISTTTVYRHLQRKYGKRKVGRKKKSLPSQATAETLP